MNGFFRPGQVVSRKPLALVPACGTCGLYRTCHTPKMEPTGRGRRGILIVAEAPGKNEDEQGIQLVGKSGQRLENTLAKAGIDLREDCWLTNALICRPPDNKINDKRVIEHCRPNLINTLKKLQPTTVILLGGTAVQSLIPYLWGGHDVGQIGRWVGWQIPIRQHGLNCWVCPTYHPAYLEREENPLLDARHFAHLRAASKLQHRPDFPTEDNYRTKVEKILCPTEAADALSDMLRTPGLFAFDYETNMLKPDSDGAKIVCCSVCKAEDDGRTIAFPWQGRVLGLMKDFLTSKEYRKIASNLKFEDRWSRRQLKVDVRGWAWDTMLNAHILDGRGKISSIKFQAFVRLGMPDYDSHIRKNLESEQDGGNSENTIHQVDPLSLLLYNGLDSLLELEVAYRQAKEMGVPL